MMARLGICEVMVAFLLGLTAVLLIAVIQLDLHVAAIAAKLDAFVHDVAPH